MARAVKSARREPIRLGVIGAGSAFSRLHWPVLAKMPHLFRLHGVACRTPERAQAVAQGLDGVRAYSHYGDLLEDPQVDAILTAVPIDMNHALLVDAIRSGKHVLAEKPIAATPEDARRVLDEIPPHAVIAIGENFRYRQDLARARRLLADGLLGELTAFQLNVKFDMEGEVRRIWTEKVWRREPRYPGGFLLDTGVHAIAFLRDLLGEVAEVFAQSLSQRPALGGPEGLLMQLRLDNGLIGQYFACYSAKLEREIPFAMVVFGRRGTLEITPGRVSWSPGPGQTGGRYPIPKSDRGYERQWRNFAGAIFGDEVLLSTPQEAYRDLLVIDAALRSAVAGGPVHVSA